MTGWTTDEFTRVGTAEELRIASLRRDGTLGSPGARSTTLRLLPR